MNGNYPPKKMINFCEFT